MAADKKSASSEARQRRRAVVDIGSNSVRLVVYEGPPRAPIAICNEKALCGLGRDMTDKGGLNPLAVADALATLARFRHILDDLGNPRTQVIATSAVRIAKDGRKFVEAAAALGFDVNVISGEEEGELAAYGVACVEPGATGLVGDMGGGSLELAALDNGVVSDCVSLPIGPLSLMHDAHDDFIEASALVEKHIDGVGFIKPKTFDTLYAVGGAWRAVARIHMSIRNYPLSVLHHYELSAAQAIEICDLISHQSRRSLEEIPGIPKRRIDTLPLAALVLKSVLKRTKSRKVSISSGGIREGLLYRELSKRVRKEDPFIAACRFYAERLSPEPRFGDAARAVLEPLFAKSGPSTERVRLGACLLSDVSAYFHPDLRGRHAFDTALRAPFVGVSHEERVWIAVALFRRHQGRSASLPAEQSVLLLSPEAQEEATQFGLALRFVAALAPKAPAALVGCQLERRGDEIIFRAASDRQALMGEFPRRRLVSLAASFDASAGEIYDD